MPTMNSTIKYLKSQEFWQTNMSTYRFKRSIELRSILAATLFLPLFISLSSCSDDLGEVPSDAGINAVGLFVSDSFKIECESEFEDPLRTDGISIAVLGALNDTNIGQSVYSFATEFSLPDGAINLPSLSNPQILSTTLVLPYSDYYGDPSATHQILSYELSQALDTNEFYSNESSRIQYSGRATQTNIQVDLLSPINVTGTDEPAGMQIDVDNSIGQKLVDNRATVLESTSDLRNVFSGLYLTVLLPTQVGGAARLDLLSEYSRLVVKFRDDSNPIDSLNDVFTLEFPIAPTATRVSNFDHQWSSAINQKVAAGKNQQEFIVHSAAGLNTILYTPDIKSQFEGKKVIIHSALLKIPVSREETDRPAHDQLYLITRSADGQAQFIPDIFRGVESYGGSYSQTDQQYIFNIAQFIQGLIDDKFENNGLVLVDGGGYFSRVYNPRRTYIAGPNATGSKLSLTLTYSLY